jgi:hypothetical protein
MNTKALTMITAATLSVLALSACGTQATMRTAQVADTQTRSSSQFASDGSPVTSDGSPVTSDGTVSSSNGGSVSIGADGVHIDTGDGSSVDIGADGTQITTGDGSVSIGADGTHIDTGDGSVSVDANGVAVTPGSTSRSKATGGTSTGSAGSATSDAGSRDAGNRQGTFGTTGHVTLTGATRFAGTASSAVCDVNADQRTTTAQLPNGMTLVIDANGLDQSSMSLADANDATWRADFNATVALAMTATTTTVAGVRLAGSNGVVTLSATFAC